MIILKIYPLIYCSGFIFPFLLYYKISVFLPIPAVENRFAGEQLGKDAADCPDVDGLGVVTGS